jgi:CMP-N-acetylneuraminic acid synthetase
VDEVFLSSDDEEILEVGRKVGAKLHIRSPGAALDESTATDVINDFLNTWAEEDIKSNPFVVYLQPTSPLRKAVDIDAAFKVIEADGGDSCISVVELIKTPFKSFILNKSGRLQTLFDEKFSNANRQVLKKAYYPNGAIYIFTVNKFLENGGIPSNGAIPFEMTSVNSIDVDTEIDLLEIMKTWPKN